MSGRLVILLLLVLAAGGGYAWWARGKARERQAYLHAARGVERAGEGDRVGSLREFEAATRLDPGNARAWYLLGSAQRDRKPGDGLPALRRAAALAPREAEYQREAGAALRNAGRFEEARALLERAVSLAPTDVAAHEELAQACLARVTSTEDRERGLAALRTVLALQPGAVQARFRLARALYQADRLPEARREFETVLALLAQGARQTPGRMDGRTRDTATWLSLVKASHDFLARIAYRDPPRARPAAVAQTHRRRFTELERYIQDTFPLFVRLKAEPKDTAAQRQLGDLFVRYGLPRAGPNGAAAAARWIGAGSGPGDSG
jgi:tetratricopeptide (TPR) repeat protein